MFKAIRDMLSGKKSYIAGAGLVLVGIADWLANEPKAMQTIIEGLMVIFLRNAVSKSANGQKAHTSAGNAEKRANKSAQGGALRDIKQNAE